MSFDEPLEIPCPDCASRLVVNPADLTLEEPHQDCKVCGSIILLAGHLCPNCHTYHDEEALVCVECGTTLARVCRSCHATNWSGLDICTACGEDLDILTLISNTSGETTSDRLHRQMAEASQIKEIEETASQKRMAELLAIERARQAEIRQRQAKQKEQEKQLLIVVFAAVALFLLALIVYAVISALN